MEEILASIRRIIADDNDAPKTDAAPDRGEIHSFDDHEDDVLDLADIAATRPTPIDLDVDVPDLSFQHVEEPEPEPFHQPLHAVEPPPAPRPSPPPIPPMPKAEAAPLPEPPQAEARPSLESIVSSQTTASVGQAFNILSHTILTQNARTLEDLVREMLKPMLKVWLDDNLPVMVERLVRAEIERVARGRP